MIGSFMLGAITGYILVSAGSRLSSNSSSFNFEEENRGREERYKKSTIECEKMKEDFRPRIGRDGDDGSCMLDDHLVGVACGNDDYGYDCS